MYLIFKSSYKHETDLLLSGVHISGTQVRMHDQNKNALFK